MNRNRAVAVATSCLGLVIAVTAAVALNLGILDRTSAEPVASDDQVVLAAAQSEPVVQEAKGSNRIFPEGTQIITVYVDEPTPVRSESVPGSSGAPAAVAPTWGAPAPAASAPAASAPAAPAPAAPASPAPATWAPTSSPSPTAAPVVAPTPAAAPTAPPAPAPTPTPSPTAVPTPAPPAVTYPIYAAGAGGEVALSYDGSSIGFWGAYPNAGWEYIVETNGPRTVKVKFRSPSGNELEFQAELEGSHIKVEVG